MNKQQTIRFNNRSFNVASILKSKDADDLVRRYTMLYKGSISEANIRELYKLATTEPETVTETAADTTVIDKGASASDEIAGETAGSTEEETKQKAATKKK